MSTAVSGPPSGSQSRRFSSRTSSASASKRHSSVSSGQQMPIPSSPPKQKKSHNWWEAIQGSPQNHTTSSQDSHPGRWWDELSVLVASALLSCAFTVTSVSDLCRSATRRMNLSGFVVHSLTEKHSTLCCSGSLLPQLGIIHLIIFSTCHAVFSADVCHVATRCILSVLWYEREQKERRGDALIVAGSH